MFSDTVCFSFVKMVQNGLGLLLLIISCFYGSAHSQLLCYVCGFSSTDTDQSCLTVTNTTQTVDCTYPYCTIVRQEYVDPSGVIASFIRSCEESPVYLNYEVTDSTFRTYYRACTNDLCNDGNGISSVTGGSLSASAGYTGSNLLVPGTGSAEYLRMNSLILFIMAFIAIYFNN